MGEVTTFRNKILIRVKDKQERLTNLTQSEVDYNTNLDVVPKVNKGIERLRKELGLFQREMGVPRPTMVHYETGDRNPSVQAFRTIMESLMSAWKSSEKVLSVETEELMFRMVELSKADIYWDQVEEVEEVEPQEMMVYDLQVDKWHNFIANGLVVHNSQMLRYMSKLAPAASTRPASPPLPPAFVWPRRRSSWWTAHRRGSETSWSPASVPQWKCSLVNGARRSPTSAP